MRIEFKKNIIVTGILFAKTEFLKNIKDYYKGDIFVNSKEEQNLFFIILKIFKVYFTFLIYTYIY